MMGRENRRTGICGESAAGRFLKRHGYRIMERNLRTPFGELDMIARHGRHLVFIEVKSRKSDSLGPPSINITRYKEASLIRNAMWYLMEKGLADALWRIDVVCVMLGPSCEPERIEIIENAVTRDRY